MKLATLPKNIRRALWIVWCAVMRFRRKNGKED